MTVAYLLTTLGLIPYFTSRAFLPLFASGLVARFGPQWESIAGYAGIQLLESIPAWVISDTCLTLLGLAAIAEIAVTKSPEMRELISLSDSQIKGVTAGALCLIFASQPLGAETIDVLQAGFLSNLSIFHLWAVGIGGITWFFAGLRNRIFEFLRDVDGDDDLGLQQLLSWLEDAIGFLGVLFVVFLPVLALIVTGATLLSLYLLRLYLQHREEKSKVPCSSCQHPGAPCGVACGRCREPRPQPLRVGLLGVIKKTPTGDVVAHRFELQSRKRCPLCGERLRSRRLDITCQSCSTAPFDSRAELELYLKSLRRRLPVTLFILAGCSLIPVVGLIPGIIYYRLSLISSLRCYLPTGSRFFGRWTVRILNLFLILLQPVPLFGMFALPLMCLTNFWIYSGLLRGEADKKLTGQAALVGG